MKVWGTLLVALALFGVGLYVTYDGLVSKEEAVFRAWADVESTLQRRADLIPNLQRHSGGQGGKYAQRQH